MNNVWLFLAVFLAGLAIGIGVEANFSERLILTHADKQVAALNSKLKTMADAAQKSADDRAVTERAAAATIKQLQQEAANAASDKPAISANVTRLINAAGLSDNSKRSSAVSRSNRSAHSVAASARR